MSSQERIRRDYLQRTFQKVEFLKNKRDLRSRKQHV